MISITSSENRAEKNVQVLLIEDSETDYILAQEYLARASASDDPRTPLYQLTWCQSVSAAKKAIGEKEFDIILLDLTLLRSEGLETLRRLMAKGIDVPIIVLSGLESKTLALEALSEGAEDFLLKHKIDEDLLSRSILYAIERYRNREELLTARKAAEARAKERASFLARMSHEIRTPLSSIIGYSELLRNDDLEPEGRQDALQAVLRNGDHLLRLLNNVIDLSKLDAGTHEASFEKLSPLEVAQQVESLMQRAAQDKGLSLDIQLQSAIPEHVESDSTFLRQILINLCNNAIKFTEKGFVRLHLSCDKERELFTFAVEDSGPGIPIEMQDKLFRPFAQVHSHRVDNAHGAGLGLSICHRLAKEIGGHVSVKSDPQKGSLFSVTFPSGSLRSVAFLEGAAAQGQTTSSLQQARLPKLNGKVLLADDVADSRKLAGIVLRQFGLEVTEVCDGEEAIEATKDTHFDLILMDMQMPKVDGYTATKEIRQRGSKMPIVALTASSLKEEIDLSTASGCNAYLAKPYTQRSLYQCLEKHLSSKPQLSDQLDKLPDFLIDESERIELMLGFMHSLKKNVDGILDCQKANDYQGLQKIAHKLKASKLYGFDDLALLATNLEQALREQKEEAIARGTASLLQVSEDILRQQEALRARAASYSFFEETASTTA